MKPIGLTFKPDGELMVVHLCLNCNKITCNRIAGDDNSHVVVCLLEDLNNLNVEISTRLISQGITLLTQNDEQNVLTILYGYDYLRRL
jgi:hypothetical protein